MINAQFRCPRPRLVHDTLKAGWTSSWRWRQPQHTMLAEYKPDPPNCGRIGRSRVAVRAGLPVSVSGFRQKSRGKFKKPAESHTHFLKGPVRSTRGNAVHLRTQLKPYELSAPPRIAQEPGGAQPLARLWSILGQFGHQVQFGPGQADSSIIHIIIYAKRRPTHVATRIRKIRPGRDVIETYKTCAVSRRFYNQKKSALLTSPPNPDRAHIDVDRFELELGSFRAPGTPIHPLGQSNLVTKGRGTPVGGRSPSNGYDSQSSTLVFVEPSMVVVAFPSTAWNGAGVAHEGGDRCYPTRHAPGLDGYGPTPAVYRGALALQKRRELSINQFGTL